MSVQPMRRRGLLAATFLIATVLMSTASPAWAGDGDDAARSKTGDFCWINGDTGYSSCYASEDARADAVLRLTGTVLVEEGSALARSASVNALASSFIVARFYDAVSYGGSNTVVSATSSTICVSGQVQNPTMPTGWNDRVSSYHSYYGCQTRVFEDTSYGGASHSAADDPSIDPPLNNEASSYRVY